MIFFEQDPPPSCGHGLCIETRFDVPLSTDEITLALRPAEQHDGGTASVFGVPVLVTASLKTGRCSPRDAEGESLLAQYGWLEDVLAAKLDWLRARAQRARVQRDRSTCFAALQRHNRDGLIPHDELFPADWDLIFKYEGMYYWAIEHHCPNPTCPCRDIVVLIHVLDSPVTSSVGQLRIDLRQARPRPQASTPRAAELFDSLWTQYAPELRARYDEVRLAVRQFAAARAAAPAPRRSPGRNEPCPCGSGKKYNRCCVDRDAAALRGAPARATR